jgi:hypothetical protein
MRNKKLQQMKKTLILVIIIYLTIISQIGFAQIEIKIQSGEKASYQVGDNIGIKVFITSLPQTCAEGMERVKFYQSGIKITSQSTWKELKKGSWMKDVMISIVGNKKGMGLLTITRNSDKESYTKQIKFMLSDK